MEISAADIGLLAGTVTVAVTLGGVAIRFLDWRYLEPRRAERNGRCNAISPELFDSRHKKTVQLLERMLESQTALLTTSKEQITTNQHQGEIEKMRHAEVLRAFDIMEKKLDLLIRECSS